MTFFKEAPLEMIPLFRSLSTYRKQGVSVGLMNGGRLIPGGLITGCIFFTSK